MATQAMALLQKGQSLPEAGRWRALAQVGILRSAISNRSIRNKLLADFKKVEQQVPEEARAEVMLLAANSERQLGQATDAETLYRRDHRQIS